VAPPFVTVAVKTALVPKQIVVPGFTVVTRLTGKFGFTVIVNIFELTGLEFGQE
jgi:hypothetical protein